MSLKLNPEKQAVLKVAEQMCIAARTAPKARGADNIVTAIVMDEADKKHLADAMRAFGEEINAAFFIRDAQNLLDCEACVLIGTRLERLRIPGCDLCGYEGCDQNEAAGARCAYNLGDLGIALGSAVSTAADLRVDNRIMYTIGRLAVKMGLLGEGVAVVYGIPLSIKGKNIFFDRK